MRWLSIVATTLLSGCASYQHDPWTKQDTILQSLVTATYVIDAVQTSEIQYRDDLHEGGAIASFALGSQPSTSGTWQYFASVAFTSYVIAYYLPARWRPFFQGGTIASQSFTIMSNCGHGLGRICHEEDHGYE